MSRAQQERDVWYPLDTEVLNTIDEIEELQSQREEIDQRISDLSTRLLRETAEAKGAYDAWASAVLRDEPPVT